MTAESLQRGAVEIDRVVRDFGGHRAVDDLSLTVNPGEFLSLLGPSGCGKTTTLRMLAGFERPDSGEIRISGVSVRDVPPDKRDVNTVFQSYALFPHMTVADNVAYGLRQRRTGKAEIRRRVGEALEMVQMLPMARRKPQSLSGGQQQRIALARAIVNRPSVLLLDEPLAALDRKLREEMQLELKLLQAELAMTFLFVTHDQGEALSMSDRIVVMLDGRVEQIADPNTLYEEPSSAFVAGFIGQQNFFPGTLTDRGGAVLTEVGPVLTRRQPPTDLPEGAPVVAAVRPECVSVVSERPTAGNTVSGRLRGIAHLGVNVQYVIETSPHHEVLAVLPRQAAQAFEIGADVHCVWDPSDTFVFPADPAKLLALASAEPETQE